jgi:hypothetical protein
VTIDVANPELFVFGKDAFSKSLDKKTGALSLSPHRTKPGLYATPGSSDALKMDWTVFKQGTVPHSRSLLSGVVGDIPTGMAHHLIAPASLTIIPVVMIRQTHVREKLMHAMSGNGEVTSCCPDCRVGFSTSNVQEKVIFKGLG